MRRLSDAARERLASTTARVEARMVALAGEKEEHRRRFVALDEALRARRAEADAAKTQRAQVLGQLEALRGELDAAERAAAADMGALAEEVKRLQAQTDLLRSAPVTHVATGGGGLVTMPGLPAAVASAEAAAKAGEAARWAALVAAEAAEGERRVAAVRAEGRKRFMELVRSIEGRYVAEFEGALGEINATQERDAAEARALEVKLKALSGSLAAAKAERARLEAEAGSARARAAAEAEARRERLADLQATLRRLWADGRVAPSEAAAFLRRVMARLPFSPAVAGVLDSKLAELRASAPILRAVLRRELVLYRMESLRRGIGEAEAGGSGYGLGPRSPAAGASLAHARAANLAALKEEYAQNTGELERLNDALLRDVAGFEAVRGKPFIYRGQRLLAVLQSSSGAVPLTTLGLPAEGGGGGGGGGGGAPRGGGGGADFGGSRGSGFLY